MPTPAPTVTFAVAALNEERLVAEFVTEAHKAVSSCLETFEFILINDGSIDATGEIMDQLSQRFARTSVLHNERNIGLGASYKRALQHTRYDHFMLLCGDGGLPAESLPAIIGEIGKADMVLPHMTNLRKLKSTPRYLLSRLYTALLNTMFGLDVRYYNGLPVHRVDLLRKLDITSEGFGYQAEIIIKLIRSGHSYAQVGVKGAERSGGSRALSSKNIVSVTRMFANLLRNRSSKTDGAP